ncbi:MAG: UDP-3-O-acyl-N-acetylglucosamine deacetylase [Cyanobacteria bacterium J06632_22]
MTPAAQSDATETAPSAQQSAQQQTLGQPVVCQGIGLHSGTTVQVRLLPAEADVGRYFVRTDVAGQPQIPAAVGAVGETTLSTELRANGTSVRTVEHLLAALWGLGLDNVRIEIDGPEVPLLDGSAQGWVGAISTAQLQTLAAPRPSPPVLEQPVSVQHGEAFVTAMPAASLRFTYGIDFDVAPIGNQWHSWSPAVEPFTESVAPARTFGLMHQIEYLRSQGLIKGGSLDNALVCGPEDWVNPPLRFENEPARHKLLDLIGDLSLLGAIPRMHVLAYKASHRLHGELAQKLTAVYAANR